MWSDTTRSATLSARSNASSKAPALGVLVVGSFGAAFIRSKNSGLRQLAVAERPPHRSGRSSGTTVTPRSAASAGGRSDVESVTIATVGLALMTGLTIPSPMRSPADDVQVQVRHRLPRVGTGVDDGAVSRIGDSLDAGDGRHDSEQRRQHGVGDVVGQSRVVGLRDDERVDRRLRDGCRRRRAPCRPRRPPTRGSPGVRPCRRCSRPLRPSFDSNAASSAGSRRPTHAP